MHYPAQSIADAINLNVQGILRLQENQTWAAVSCFSDGLEAVMTCIKKEGVADSNHHCHIPMHSETLVSIELPLHGGKQVGAEDDTGNDYKFALYDRALHIQLDDRSNCCCSDMDDNSTASMVSENYCHTLSAVFLFNVGLAYHRCALQSGQSQLLDKALDFYWWSHRTMMIVNQTQNIILPCTSPRDEFTPQDHHHHHHQRHGGDPKETTPTGNTAKSRSGASAPDMHHQHHQQHHDLLLLALANNQGQIHLYFCHHLEAKLCADYIIERLSMMVSPEYGNTVGTPVFTADKRREQEYRYILLNASFFAVAELMPARSA